MLLSSTTFAVLLALQAPVPVAAPSFDAASIRKSPPLTFARIKTNPGRLTISSATLERLVEEAYGISPLRIAGAPPLGSFDIEAVAAGTHSRAERLTMLQTLLTERFKLTVHREMREMPVLALTTTKSWKGQPTSSPEADPTLGLHSDRSNGKIDVGQASFDGQNATVEFIARYVEPRFGRVVLDQTGLTGAFDFHVTVQMDAERVADKTVPEREIAKDLITDFIGKLGLKMEAKRAMVEVLVVDHAEQPSQN